MANDWFGRSVAIGEDFAVVGAHGDNVGSNTDQGSAYVFGLPPAPDLAIVKAVQPTTAAPGEAVTYTLAFSNSGDATAMAVGITDIVPVSITVQSVVSSGVAITDSGTSPPYVWQVQNLASQEGGVITITAILSQDLPCGDSVVNRATITTTTAESNSANNSSDTSVTIKAVYGVSVSPGSDSASGDPGEEVIYSLRVTNTGNCADTFAVTVTVPLDAACGDGDAVTVGVTSQGDGTSTASSLLSSSTNTVYGVSVSPGSDSASGDPGEEVIVLSNDTDANCSALSANLHTPPANGVLMLNLDGSFIYTPTLNFYGYDSFTYYAHDGSAASNLATVAITITGANDGPIVDAGEDQTADEGQTVQFAGSFVDPDSRAPLAGESILWDFGDGTTITGTLTPTHTYADNDLYPVSLTVTDTQGAAGHGSLLVTVLNVPPLVFAGQDQLVKVGAAVSFRGAFTEAGWLDTHTIEWDLGDGTTITGTQVFSHTYITPDIYAVTLEVIDNNGGIGTDTVIITVERRTIRYYFPIVLRQYAP